MNRRTSLKSIAGLFASVSAAIFGTRKATSEPELKIESLVDGAARQSEFIEMESFGCVSYWINENGNWKRIK